MTFPLCYHVIQVLAISETEYFQAMGNVNFVPIFGEWFARFFPILLFLGLSLKALDVYDKALRMLGLGEEFGGEGRSVSDEHHKGELALQAALSSNSDSAVSI